MKNLFLRSQVTIKKFSFFLFLCSSLYALQEKEMPPAKLQAYNVAPREWEFFAKGDFLYYYITEDELQAGFSYETGQVSTFPSTVFGGKSLEMDFQWEPGFRVALGYGNHSKDNSGEIFLQYFQIKESATKSAVAPSGGSLQTNWVQYAINTFPSATSINAAWKLKTQLLDLLACRVYTLLEGMTFRPMLGIRGAWIDQKYNLTSLETTLTDHASVHAFAKSDSWAVGLRANIDSHWILGRGFYLFNDFGGSILFTDYKIRRNEKLLDGTVRYQARYREDTTRFNVDIKAGLGWQMEFANHIGIMAKASYDFAVFFNQNMIRNSVDSILPTFATASSIGNLYMQGLDIQLGLSY